MLGPKNSKNSKDLVNDLLPPLILASGMPWLVRNKDSAGPEIVTAKLYETSQDAQILCEVLKRKANLLGIPLDATVVESSSSKGNYRVVLRDLSNINVFAKQYLVTTLTEMMQTTVYPEVEWMSDRNNPRILSNTMTIDDANINSEKIKKQVYEKYGILLNPEVTVSQSVDPSKNERYRVKFDPADLSQVIDYLNKQQNSRQRLKAENPPPKSILRKENKAKEAVEKKVRFVATELSKRLSDKDEEAVKKGEAMRERARTSQIPGTVEGSFAVFLRYVNERAMFEPGKKPKLDEFIKKMYDIQNDITVPVQFHHQILEQALKEILKTTVIPKSTRSYQIIEEGAKMVGVTLPTFAQTPSSAIEQDRTEPVKPSLPTGKNTQLFARRPEKEQFSPRATQGPTTQGKSTVNLLIDEAINGVDKLKEKWTLSTSDVNKINKIVIKLKALEYSKNPREQYDSVTAIIKNEVVPLQDEIKEKYKSESKNKRRR